MLLEATTTQTIIREISADLETPISVYMKLRGDGASFLLESVEGGERIARYSFIGVKPKAQYIIRDNQIEVIKDDETQTVHYDGDPTFFLQEEMNKFTFKAQAGVPRFIGGLVGYLGYESVRFFEPVLKSRMNRWSSSPVQVGAYRDHIPDGIFLLADTIIAFDHARRSLSLIANVLDGDVDSANRKLDEIESRIHQPLPATQQREIKKSKTTSNMTQGRFEDMVRDAKEYILAGDIFQGVLSQRFTRESNVEPFDVYRAVRRLNPSPYMFFFDFGLVDDEPLFIVGSSPEMFVRLEGRTASLRPIAGTRPRGADSVADAALAQELLADPKERAEHVMLVDLGRNDLGRVCEYGTVKVSDFFTVEKYSHVMHIVSHVEGKLKPDLTAFDLVRAAFPAGTVSGAPKVRALEIISELEPDARDIYAGMIGYFGFDGNMDTCLALRTMVARGNTFSVQAGAGIVADSNPTTEFQETVNKASAMLKAIEMAETNS
ncbi:MAG TPA: anthranilate synthase component I [Anaerolineales bacterium]|nr:anthranilate synthase component I [Anaerolineales bacterium]HNS61568.1 anthranilate synthase component I [Anaerolineales bacterium]